MTICDCCSSAELGLVKQAHSTIRTDFISGDFPKSSALVMPGQHSAAALPGSQLLTQTLADASAELDCRVEMGEFDDLEDAQLGDLRLLSTCLAQWANRARMIEQGDIPVRAAAADQTPDLPASRMLA